MPRHGHWPCHGMVKHHARTWFKYWSGIVRITPRQCVLCSKSINLAQWVIFHLHRSKCGWFLSENWIGCYFESNQSILEGLEVKVLKSTQNGQTVIFELPISVRMFGQNPLSISIYGLKWAIQRSRQHSKKIHQKFRLIVVKSLRNSTEAIKTPQVDGIWNSYC